MEYLDGEDTPAAMVEGEILIKGDEGREGGKEGEKEEENEWV